MTPVGNKSLAKSLTVLDTPTFSSSPLSAAQVSYPLKLTQPTIYRILGTLACPMLRQLAAQFRETVHLAMEEGGRIVCLDAVAGVSRAMGGRPR